jgi:GT2 family glycosyltransferase
LNGSSQPVNGRPGSPEICAVVVLYQSARVIERCLEALRAAAPRRGVTIRVVDNASTDDGAMRAARLIGEQNVRRRAANGGFAAGVNTGLAGASEPWLAVVNPDLIFAPGSLDALADFLESHPTAGLVGPRVELQEGGREETAGDFPTPHREWAHAWMLDRLLGLPGRHRPQPVRPERVDWTSGCAWLIRREAWSGGGPLDEGYFMYFEDVDLCRRLLDAGWESWCCPGVFAVHARGTGSSESGALPADGGEAAVRYMMRFHPGADGVGAVRTLRHGWWLRANLHRVLAVLGSERSRRLLPRYRSALAVTSKSRARAAE